MFRYYRELHDRELLSQAESIIAELSRRQLMEIRVPCDSSPGEDDSVPCSVGSVVRNGSRLSVLVDQKFERRKPWSAEKANTAASSSRGS
jgi:hypothetical protein